LTLVRRYFAAILALTACDDGPGSAGCYGVCGEGTECRNGQCVVAEAKPVEAAEPMEEPEGKSGKRRRRGKSAGGAAEAAAVAFTAEDDSHVPEYDANKTQVIDLKAGSERLDDAVVNTHLRRLEPKFNACIEIAAEHSEDELRGGEVDFTFSIAGSGRVESVSVKAPAHLRVFGIVPCLRNALASHRFPKFDGPTMGVDYSFKVG
jgi:hypothetical protein